MATSTARSGALGRVRDQDEPIFDRLAALMVLLATVVEQAFDVGSDRADAWAAQKESQLAQTQVIKTFVKSAFAIVVGVILLNELFGLGIVTNSSGPFASTIDTLETILGAALIFVVLGLLAYGGSVAMSYMDAF